MPIRFRCAYCNQLLGISRRKAGTVIRCPTCTGQVVVPHAPADEQEDDRPGKQLVFERDNFDQLLNANESDPVALPKQGSGAVQFPVAAPSAEIDERTEAGSRMEKAGPMPARPTQTAKLPLAQSRSFGVAVLVGVLMVLAFGAGMWVGYSLKPATGSISQEATNNPAR